MLAAAGEGNITLENLHFCIYSMCIHWHVVMRCIWIWITLNDLFPWKQINMSHRHNVDRWTGQLCSCLRGLHIKHVVTLAADVDALLQCLTWFFKSSLGHGRPPLKAFSLSHLDRICNPLPQEALQADQADQSLSLQSRGHGMWQTSTT